MKDHSTNLIHVSLLAAAATLSAAPLHAHFYRVDVSGTDDTSGHSLRVSGIIDVNVDTDEIAYSSLSIIHEADAPVPLDAVEVVGDGVDFIDVSGSLQVAPRRGDGRVRWDTGELPISLGLFVLWDIDFLADVMPTASILWHHEPRFDDPNQDEVSVQGHGYPVIIGTAVPEASAMHLLLVGLGVLGATHWRKRRMLNSALRS